MLTRPLGLDRRTRRACDALVRAAPVPDPWSLEQLLWDLGVLRERPIVVDAVDEMPGEISAMWVAMPDADVIFHSRTGSTLYRENNVLHEVGHMLWGDDRGACSPVSDQDRKALLAMPEFVECRGAAMTILTRDTRFENPVERRAEYIAHQFGVLADRRRPTIHDHGPASPLSSTMRRTLGSR